MTIDSWLLIEQTALTQMWSDSHPVGDPAPPIPDNVRILNQAIRGYWNDKVDGGNTYEVVNVLASEADLDQFMTDHAADVLTRYDWIQGPAVDALDTQGQTVPAEVLELMRDHQRGDPPVPEAPTYEDPNWGHVFLGQGQRIFAGEFSGEFTGEYL